MHINLTPPTNQALAVAETYRKRDKMKKRAGFIEYHYSKSPTLYKPTVDGVPVGSVVHRTKQAALDHASRVVSRRENK